MSTKKVPLRQCIGCGEMKSKKEMIRILRTESEGFVVDATGRKNGRGAYPVSYTHLETGVFDGNEGIDQILGKLIKCGRITVGTCGY